MKKPILSPHVKVVHSPTPPRHEFTPPPPDPDEKSLLEQMKNIAKTKTPKLPKIKSAKLPRSKKKK